VYWTISGDGFTELTSILVDDTAPTSFSIVNDSLLRVQGPSKPRGTYDVTLTTPTATEVFANAVVYSDVPVWSTPSTISVAASSAYSLSFQGTSDSIVTYVNETPIPPDTVLDTSTGALTGPGITESVLYSIDMKAIDEELQYKTQTFQVALLAGALNTVVSVHSMSKGVAALTDSGALYAWGPGFELDPSYPLPTLSSSGSMAGSLAGKSVSSVSSGNQHTMVIATDGTLHGFGLNNYGQLAGSNRVYRTPILINSGSLSGKSVSSVAWGAYNTMVIATDGTLHGFGYNGSGQLGDGTYTTRPSPVLINGGSLSGKSVSSVAGGQNHTMVIATDGTLHGFGYNAYGGLGDGTNTNRPSPVLINGGSLSGKSVSSVACGQYYTMVIATDGTLHGFGINGNGNLGDGTTTSRSSPVLINGGSLSGKSVSSVACGQTHTMVIATDGTLHGFGYNYFGQLGDGSQYIQSRPSPVLSNGGSLSGKSVSSVACGAFHTMVIATDGTLHGFGYNLYGNLGDGTTTNRPSPVLSNGGSLSGKSVSSVACGAHHTMVIATDGTLHGFGLPDSFQLGVQTQTIIFTNRGSLSGKSVSSVACSQQHTMVIATDGTLHGFGYNAFGNLGDGTTTNRPSPLLINGGSLSGKSVSSVACSQYYTMVIATDGTLHGFGYNYYGNLGDGTTTDRPSPVLINGGSLSGKSVLSVACGQIHTMVIATDGTLHGFGYNGNGNLGDGTTTNRPSPVLINGGSLSGKSVSSVACGAHHTMVIATDGTLHGFGANYSGQLGDGTLTNQPSPVLSNGGSLSGKSVSSVACVGNGNESYALATDGTIHRLSTTTYLLGGVTLSGKTITNFQTGYISHIRTSDNESYAFGDNSYGQIGIIHNTYIQDSSPVLLDIPLNLV